MITSEDIAHISAAIVKAQASVRMAVKDAKNPHLKSEYATLRSVIEAVREPMADAGLGVVQVIVKEGDGAFLRTRLMHTSGQFLQSDCPLSTGKGDMQSLGAAVTYARRYSLAALMGVAQADDDGRSIRPDVPERFARSDTGEVSLGALREWAREIAPQIEECGCEDELLALLATPENAAGQVLLQQHLPDWFFGRDDAAGFAQNVTKKQAELRRVAPGAAA